MKVLVTGAGGFLGGAVARKLLARGHTVRGFSRGRYPALEALGAEYRSGDLGDPAAVVEAARGCDAVIHVAAKPGIWGPEREYRLANVTGTENVIAACLKTGISRLVYTSSASVVFHGGDLEGADESSPYPEHHLTAYTRTKAQAERLALAANGPRLATLSLRPHLIWGPGDNHLIPRMIARARAGRLRAVGRRANRIDSIYIDNAADAHHLALEKLVPGAPVGGKAYFISQGEPVPLMELVNSILETAGISPVQRSVPSWLAYGAGALFEALYGALRVQAEPPMTRFLALQLSRAHWFDLGAARRDLGYAPAVSIAEGLRRLREDFESSPR